MISAIQELMEESGGGPGRLPGAGRPSLRQGIGGSGVWRWLDTSGLQFILSDF
jgi:hypothetical protein